MKPATVAKPRRIALKGQPGDAWRDRAGRLFAEYERPAHAMLRRAFRGAFDPHEADDIYANAWTGTLRSLADRHQDLTDDEIRSYVLTAVANQAGKELRRRRRKPVASLETDAIIADTARGPDEVAAGSEESRIARDLLSSLPKRRRAVILLRYGWGLEPAQICELVKGLSPRAYRKEITRGVDELAERMRSFEAGTWCAEREPLLKALVAGVADEEQQRQAKAHVAHCRDCSRFVARLSGHLHDFGAAVSGAVAAREIELRMSMGERVAGGIEGVRDSVAGAFARTGSTPSDEVVAQVTAAGGSRGAGAAGAGVLAKLAGLGTAGKLTAACLGGGVAATACVAAGIGPVGNGAATKSGSAANDRPAERAERARRPAPPLIATPVPAQTDPAPSPPSPGGSGQSTAEAAPAADEPAPAPPAGSDPVAPETAPIEQEFGVPAAAAPAPAAPAPAPSSGPEDSGVGGGSASTVRQEFGP